MGGLMFVAELSVHVPASARCPAGFPGYLMAYLPRGGLLVMLLGRFRDDVREALDLEEEDIPRRGKEHRPLDEMTSAELDAAWGAFMILLQDRFMQVMDDPDLPKLLHAFQGDLSGQKTEREQIRASIAS